MGLYVCVYATSLHPFEDATKELEADHVPTLHKTVLWYFELHKVLFCFMYCPLSKSTMFDCA